MNEKARCTANDNRIITVWDEHYFVQAATTNSTTKQRRVVQLAQAEGLLNIREVPFDAEATWADIATVHDPAYVQAVRTGTPRRLAESQGFRWSPEFADSVARIWTGHIAACEIALPEGLVLHPVSGAHHASYERGGGFCTFNYLAGAARALARRGTRPVGIVDLDAHPGDGTYAVAKGNLDIAIFDIAQGNWITVAPDERHEYHDVEDAAEYRRALQKLPAFLDRVRPALVQYQAGVDCFEEDPVGGVSGATAEFLRFRDQFVIGHLLHRGIPVVVNLAGGYIEGLSEQLHVQTIRVAVEVLRRERVGEFRSFDPQTGEVTDDALHAELLGDDIAPWDLNLDGIEQMTDEQIDNHIEEHCRRNYSGDANPKPDRK